MNIKEKIGSRIAKIRKEKGLTIKELSLLTENLKPPRISNWEHGSRSPGPEEALKLAKALDVSPAYLLCLTDEIHLGNPKKIPEMSSLIPLLDDEQTNNTISMIEKIKKNTNENELKIEFISFDKKYIHPISENNFALKIKSDSMEPKIKIGDVVIVNMDKKPKPGDLVAAKLKNDSEIIIRQYKQISYSHSFESFELVTLNKNWANIEIKNKEEGEVIGCVIEIRHYC